MLHRLNGSRCYLIGGMDMSPDHGMGWRRVLKQWLWERGIGVFDPTAKPSERGEEIESKHRRDELIKRNEWKALRSDMGFIRHIDLRMTDLSDFIVCYLDLDIPTCGTWEEMATANASKKPILTVIKQGKKRAPHWMLGMLPPTNIFSSFEQLKRYIVHIDEDESIDDLGRWLFFKYDELLPATDEMKKELVERQMDHISHNHIKKLPDTPDAS